MDFFQLDEHCKIDPYSYFPNIPPMFFDEQNNFINPYINGALRAINNDKFTISCHLNGFRDSALSEHDSWEARYPKIFCLLNQFCNLLYVSQMCII